MLKKITRLLFCTDKFRFQAAEELFLMAFNYKEPLQYKPLAFHYKFLQKIQYMAINKLIDAKTEEQLKQMFIPTRGITIDQNLQELQNQRSDIAKNNKNMVAFCLNSVLLIQILNLMFQRGQKLQRRVLAQTLFIVGTPGIGKSLKFYLVKVLLDMRIPYLIKKGSCQSNFRENYKFVYFHAAATQKSIMKKMLKQVQRDFGEVSKNISQINIREQKNMEIFMSKVAQEYYLKKIQLRLIIDQINSLYDLKDNKRAEQIKKWMRIQRFFQLPIVMISSKNNSYIQKFDPVLFFSSSTKAKDNHLKIIIDNQIAPEKRLKYSYDCLVFELLKYQLTQEKLIQILKTVSLPLLTHFSIANAVKKAFKDFNSKQNELKKAPLVQFLNKKLKFIQTLQNVQKMMRQSHTSPEKIKLCLKFMSNFLSFSCKNTIEYEVKLQFDMENSNKLMEKIQKKTKIPQKQFQKVQKFQTLSDFNYFFTYEMNQTKYLFYCTSIKEMEVIRMEIMRFVKINFLQNLRKKYKKEFQNLMKYNSGSMFQTFVCHLYYIGLLKNNTIITKISHHHNNEEYIYHRVSSLTEDLFQMNEQESYKILFQPKSQYIKNSASNAVFDFILSDFETKNKRIILVDTTVSTHTLPIVLKISKFKKILFGKQSKFRSQILKYLESDKQYQIQIIYYVLTAQQTEGPKVFKNFRYNQQVALEILEQDVEDSLEKQLEKKINRQTILSGVQNFEDFFEQLRQKKLEKRLFIKFMKGALVYNFEIKCKCYTPTLKQSIYSLPEYIVRNNKIAILESSQ